MNSLLDRFRYLSRKRQVGIVLILLLLAVTVTLFSYQKFSADTDTRLNISGRVFNSASEGNQPLEGVKVTVSAQSVSDGENVPEPIKAISDNLGGFNLTLPDETLYNLILFEKEGYWDIEGTFTLLSQASDPKEVTLALPMKAGFGKESVHLQTIMPSWNLISTPLVPEDPNPASFFAYYDIASDPTTGQGLNTITKKTIDPDAVLTRWDNDTQSVYTYDAWSPEQFGQIKTGQGYWLQFTGQTPQTVVMYGSKTDNPYPDGTLTINKAGWALIGLPTTNRVKMSEIGIIYNEDTINLLEAFEKGLVVNILSWDSTKQSLNNYDQYSESCTLPVIGSGLWIETTINEITVSLGSENKSYGFVEVPSDLSIEDLKWIGDVNHFELDEVSYQRWQDIDYKLNKSAFDYLLENTPSGLDEEDKPISAYITYTKNNKVVINTPKDISSAKINYSLSSSMIIKPTSVLIDIDKRCARIEDNQVFTICAFDGMGDVPWPNQMFIDEFRQFVTNIYPEIKSLIGDPIGHRSDPLHINIIVRIRRYPEYAGISNSLTTSLFINEEDLHSLDSNNWSWNDDAKFILTHELVHKWDGAYSFWNIGRPGKGFSEPNKIGIESGFREGMANLITYLIAVKRNSIDTLFVSQIKNQLKWYRNGMRSFLYANSDNAYQSWRGELRQYKYSTVSIAQLYAHENDVFKKFELRLKEKYLSENTYTMLKAVMPEYMGSHYVGYEKFDNWWSYQWGGLVQPPPAETGCSPKPSGVNKKIGINPYAYLTKNVFGHDSVRLQLLRVKNGNGDIQALPFHSISNLYVLKILNGKTGYYRVPHVYDKWTTLQGTDEILSNIIDLSEPYPIEKGKKYSLVTEFYTWDWPKPKPRINTLFYAMPYDNAGIYGVVAESNAENGGSVWITPKNTGLPKKPFPIKYGYFQTDIPEYGLNAGIYKVSYQTKTGKWRHNFVNKLKGQAFVDILSGKYPEPSEDMIKSTCQLQDFLSNEHIAYAEEPDFEELIIFDDSVKKEITASDTIDISLLTNNPSIVKADWGLTLEYDNTSNYSEEVKPSDENPNDYHRISLRPLEFDKIYHLNITAIDATGTPETQGNDATNAEEENGELTEYTMSGDLTITPFNITDVNVSATTNLSTITWNTSVPTNSKVCYGKTADYGTCTDLTADLKTNHEKTISNLTAGTTYHFQIYAEADDGTIRYSDDNTFTTKQIVNYNYSLSSVSIDSLLPPPDHQKAIINFDVLVDQPAPNTPYESPVRVHLKCNGCSPADERDFFADKASHHNITFDNLQADKEYTFSVYIKDVNGNEKNLSGRSFYSTLAAFDTQIELPSLDEGIQGLGCRVNFSEYYSAGISYNSIEPNMAFTSGGKIDKAQDNLYRIRIIKNRGIGVKVFVNNSSLDYGPNITYAPSSIKCDLDLNYGSSNNTERVFNINWFNYYYNGKWIIQTNNLIDMPDYAFESSWKNQWPNEPIYHFRADYVDDSTRLIATQNSDIGSNGSNFQYGKISWDASNLELIAGTRIWTTIKEVPAKNWVMFVSLIVLLISLFIYRRKLAK